MRLYYYHAPNGNFGDDLNGWLWERLLPDQFSQASLDTVFVCIGTILDRFIPPARKTIVFGSGVGYHPLPSTFGDAGWDIVCVRGPLTAKFLDLPLDKAVTDAAILIASLPEYEVVPEAERRGIVFMPHVGALETGRWREVCEAAGVTFLDPRAESRSTIDKIRTAKLVLADAMHAAIVADAVRVPWVPLATSGDISSFKWRDWAGSLAVPYVPVTLPPSTRLDVLKDLMNRLLGETHKVDPAVPDDVLIAAFRAACQRKQSKLSLFLSKIVHAGFRRLVRFVQARPFFCKVLKAQTGARIERAARVLRKAAAMPGFLSDEAVHKARLDEMLSRLSRVHGA